ncbi:type I-B CRISPR-associated protein Cas8b1/Cst1 [Thermovibrio sp.]
MERIYLGDWLYNAGIVGLLRALGGSYSKDGKLHSEEGKVIEGVTLEENFIEIQRELLKGYAENFFKRAAKNFIDSSLRGRKFVVSKEPTVEDLKKLNKQLKGVVRYFKTLEVNLPARISKENLFEAKEELEKAVKELKEFLQRLPEEETENLALKWLSKGFFPKRGGDSKSAPHKSKENFFKKVELPLFSELRLFEKKVGKEKISVPCIICQEREAKEVGGKVLSFDTYVSGFAGLNKDAVNFIHLDAKIKNLPICEVCNLVLMSVPLGVVESSDGTFLFVNNSSSAEELFNDNQRFEAILLKSATNPLLDFFTEKLLMKEKEKAELSLVGVAVVEIEFGTFPRVKSFNLSLKKAKFFTTRDFTETLKRLRTAYYKEGSYTENLLYRTVEMILSDRVSHLYLHRLLKLYLKGKSKEVSLVFSPYHLNLVNLTFLRYFKTVLEDRMSVNLSENELWFLWKRGNELKKELERADSENKINSLAFKLLNALKTGNYHRFLDILLRVYSGLNLEVPSTFVRVMTNEETFKTAGYSFVCGLLNNRTKKGEEDG